MNPTLSFHGEFFLVNNGLRRIVIAMGGENFQVKKSSVSIYEYAFVEGAHIQTEYKPTK